MTTKITAPVVLAVLVMIASAAIIGGVALLAGFAWGSITAGVLMLAVVGVLYDPGNDSS